MSIEIRDARGETVNVLEASGAAGLNQVEWTLERMGEASGGRGGGFFRRRNFVEAGEYTAVLRADGAEYIAPITVGGR